MPKRRNSNVRKASGARLPENMKLGGVVDASRKQHFPIYPDNVYYLGDGLYLDVVAWSDEDVIVGVFKRETEDGTVIK